MSVGLVLVSHSARIAEGTAELAREMAPDVVVRCGAGDPDGGLGTSLDRVQAALSAALEEVDAVVVLADLGSAVLTVETAFELDDDLARRARLASAPFVEGAVAAAVAAQQGAELEAVLAGAEGAAASLGAGSAVEMVETETVGAADSHPAGAGAGDGVVSRRVTVRNPLGLHARPAAVLARTIADLGVPVTVDGVDGTSVLQLLALGATGGRELEIAARGEGADAAVAAVVGMIEGGFGEV